MMKFDVILLRYGELSLKSNYVRKIFEARLIQNIKKAFLKENIPHDIRTDRGRIYLLTPELSKSISVLPQIFGIVSFSPAIETTSAMQDISTRAQTLMKSVLTKQKSFAIRVTRVGTHPYSSQDVAVHIGNDIVTATHARVNLRNPDVELFIEIREKKSFLFTEKIKGAGGLPMGTQGRILALVENPSSLLAAWYLMHRGCNVVLVYTDTSMEGSLVAFLRRWYTDAETIFLDTTREDIYQRLSVIASEKKCDALVTGHSLGDSINPLPILLQCKKNSVIPILSPLIAMTREESTGQCKKKGILV